MGDHPPTSGLRPGQRALAAIVFTDVVGFSARVQEDEERSLRLLERDFADMRELSRHHEGQVLKTTGDGLLLFFGSAVQAVACALAMQRLLADRARRLPASEILAHRIGIHLGDVFIGEQDVMGDGVNIAARVQAEAEPGGICISQTVYDVVKGKLELHVTSLGPRELKNIAEAIPIYRLLLDAQALRSAQAAELAARLRDTASAMADSAAPFVGAVRSVFSRPAFKWCLLAGLVGVLALTLYSLWQTEVQERRAEAETERIRLALAAEMSGAPGAAGADVEEYNRLVEEAWQPARQMNRQYLSRYDFTGLQEFLRERTADHTLPHRLPALEQSAAELARLRDWMTDALQGYTQERPLKVSELTGASPKELRIFAKDDGLLYFVGGGAVRGRDWSELRPGWISAIIVGTLLDAHKPPGHDVVQGALAFSRLYGQPEIVTTLTSRKAQRGTNR